MLYTNTADRTRFLPTSSRTVWLENRWALLRRWRLVRAGLLSDARLVTRWFPGQRPLLDLLEVLDEADVERIADCGTPLFGLPLRCTDFSLEACAAFSCLEGIEQESVQESFLALSGRLDAVRTSLQQACVLFGMTHAEASWLSRYCPQELHLLARDPAMVLTPIASYEYYVAAAHADSQLSSSERTVLSAVSRRPAGAPPA